MLLGPTASGKSRLALALAERLPAEIVSVDSALVYREMDIGTAKPTAEERMQVPHHLVDLVAPDEAYSAGRWREDAIRAVTQILARGRLPILVGGTMLYYKTLVSGLDALPGADPALRARIDAEASARGWPALHAELGKVDPASAARIKPGDAQRIQRALEVWRLTGRPLSALQGVSRSSLPFDVHACARTLSRPMLHAAIERRFDEMLERGLVQEVERLRAKYRLTAEMPSMRAVGYRQAWAFLEGELTREQMRTRALAATRQLAKRQMTWLRSFPDLLWLDAGDGHDPLAGLAPLLDAGARALGRA